MVVTIVVLLILAGVSISLILDNNGIIQKSKDAKQEYGKARDNEQADLNKVSDWIDKQANESEETSKPIKVRVDEKAKSNGTINGEKGDSLNPTIPEKYTPINTSTSNWGDGSTAPSQEAVNNGLVIRDDSNNEWVWIPVDSETLATMYETSSDEKTLCGTTGETAVTTKQYSKSGIISGKTRTTPGTTTQPYYREPDLTIGSDSVSYDTKAEYYNTILGFESKEKMAEAFVADYNEMIASISKYGGFYIGRYELSEVGVQKDQPTLTNTNWYDLYKKCKELNASNKVETRMIWGCQWDLTMNWLIDSKAKTDTEVNINSSSWGNYFNTSVKADDGTTKIKANEESSKLNTGKTTFTIANNIYDLAGNCYEWTQEAGFTNYRAVRGGSYNFEGRTYPASDRQNGRPDDTSTDYIRFSSYFNNKV